MKTGGARGIVPGDETGDEAPKPAGLPDKDAVSDGMFQLPEKAKESSSGRMNPQDLSREEKETVEKLRARDREVRAHEQAHLAAGGPYTGGVQYEFAAGPDGSRYAVGGEVKIDVSEVPDDPQATIQKAQVIRRAALAPANPSPADRKVASQASRMERRARAELAEEKAEEAEETREESAGKTNVSGEEAAAEKPKAPEIDALSPAPSPPGGVATLEYSYSSHLRRVSTSGANHLHFLPDPRQLHFDIYV